MRRTRRGFAAAVLVLVSVVLHPPAVASVPGDNASIVPDQPSVPQGWFFDVRGICPATGPNEPSNSVDIAVGDVKVGTLYPQALRAGVDFYTGRIFLWPTIEPGDTALKAECASGATATVPLSVMARVPRVGAELSIDDITPSGLQNVVLTGRCPTPGEAVVLIWGDLSHVPGDFRGSLLDVKPGPDGRFRAPVRLSTTSLGPEAFSAFCRNGASAEVKITVVPPGTPEVAADPQKPGAPPAAPAHPTPGAPALTG